MWNNIKNYFVEKDEIEALKVVSEFDYTSGEDESEFDVPFICLSPEE